VRRLLTLLPPDHGCQTLSASPLLDPALFAYDERALGLLVRAKPCSEQAVTVRARSGGAGFRLEPGPYDPVVVRERRLARQVLHLFHPDAPLVLTLLGVFHQTTLNINFRA
jgi:hypothetical protein